MPDLTGGARYFQNPRTVAARAAAGQGSPGLVDFGGTPSTAVIGDHHFYASANPGGPSAAKTTPRPQAGGGIMIVNDTTPLAGIDTNPAR